MKDLFQILYDLTNLVGLNLEGGAFPEKNYRSVKRSSLAS
jgi:hypothetical protein